MLMCDFCFHVSKSGVMLAESCQMHQCKAVSAWHMRLAQHTGTHTGQEGGRSDLSNPESKDNAVALHDDVFTAHARLEHIPVAQRVSARHAYQYKLCIGCHALTEAMLQSHDISRSA